MSIIKCHWQHCRFCLYLIDIETVIVSVQGREFPYQCCTMENNKTLKLPSTEDSFDEDTLSDVDDEVFIKSSRNGFRNSDKTLQKPLMAPRQKHEKVYMCRKALKYLLA